MATRTTVDRLKPRLGNLPNQHKNSTSQWHHLIDHVESSKKLTETGGTGYSDVAVGATCIGMGLVFGIALEKGQVYLPDVIRAQFLFQDNTMLKMFLSAIASSAVCQQVLKRIYKNREALNEYYTITRGVLAVVLGGLMLGFGMQLSGSCPGTVWIQTGTQTTGFLPVWLGGASGAFVFAYVYQHLEKLGVFSIGRDFLVKHPSLPDQGYTGFVLAVAMVVIVFVVDHLSPQAQHYTLQGNPLTMVAWHPAIAGILVGLLEVPGSLIVGQLLGSSQSYVTLGGRLSEKFVPESSIPAYTKKYLHGLANYVQVFWFIGAVMGALLSWIFSHQFSVTNLFHHSASLSLSGAAESFGGGFLLVFGARLAAGCTSGHGISGIGSLATGSFLAVAAMFGGAIALAVIRAL